jgi:hypothetical protein
VISGDIYLHFKLSPELMCYDRKDGKGLQE